MISPRLGMPALKLGGQELLIELKSNRFFPDTKFKAFLQNDFHQYPLSINSVEQQGNYLTLHSSIPQNSAKGQYKLVIEQGGQSWSRDSAVFVYKHFSKDLKVIQFADLPWLSDRLGNNSAGDKILAKFVAEANLIHPDLVLVSGDNAYGGSWGQYESLFYALKKLTVPLVIVPGNHEYQGWNGYLSFFGKTRHSIDYGNYRIISFNSGHARDQITWSQFNWLKKQFEQAPDKHFIVQLHHPLFGSYGPIQHLRNELLDLFKQYHVQIVLSGHVHADSVYNQQGENLKSVSEDRPLYAVVTTAGNTWRKQYATSNIEQGYRLLRFNQKGKLINYSYDADGDGKRDASASIPWNFLQVEQVGPLHYRVKNLLNESFSKARVRYQSNKIMDYKSNMGQIVSQQKNNNSEQIDVEFDLPAHTTVDVRLIP